MGRSGSSRKVLIIETGANNAIVMQEADYLVTVLRGLLLLVVGALRKKILVILMIHPG